MKKLIGLLFVALILMGGCMNLPAYTYAPFANYSAAPNEEKAAGIGDIFFSLEEGQTVTEPTYLPEGTVATGTRFDLTIVELNHENLGLQYNEFFSRPARTSYDGIIIPGAGWMVKQGFNKRFDYAVADKIIRFKGFEFEILDVENGQIKYRRIK